MAILDHEVCADIGSQGASCVHTLSTITRDIEKPQWDDERFGQLCMTADSYSDLKSVIEKLCSLSDRCNYQAQIQIARFFARIELLKQRVAR